MRDDYDSQKCDIAPSTIPLKTFRVDSGPQQGPIAVRTLCASPSSDLRPGYLCALQRHRTGASPSGRQRVSNPQLRQNSNHHRHAQTGERNSRPTVRLCVMRARLTQPIQCSIASPTVVLEGALGRRQQQPAAVHACSLVAAPGVPAGSCASHPRRRGLALLPPTWRAKTT